MISNMEAGVRAVANAEDNARLAGAELAVADGKIAKLRERVTTLDAERAEIVRARQAGAHDPNHGARLAEIAADVEGLSGLISHQSGAAAPLRTAAAEAAQAVIDAKSALTRTQATEWLAALVAHARELDNALVATLTALREAQVAIGIDRPVWYPSPALTMPIRKLELQREGMA